MSGGSVYGLSVGEALASVRWALRKISDAPDLDAQWLLLSVLDKKEVSWLYTHGEEKLNDKQSEVLEELAGRRKKGEPLAYILGEWEFYGREFYVNKDVLVPRPSTELLVDKALSMVKKLLRESDGNDFLIADIGTGSGCVVVSLALELVNINFIATDISTGALNIARRNAKRHGVLDRVEFRQGSMLEPLKDEHVDLIVSNPPYVPSGELALSSNNVQTIGLGFEPRIALDGGDDGTTFIKTLTHSTFPMIIETINGSIRCVNIS